MATTEQRDGLAMRAAAFHRSQAQRTLAVRARMDPEAWAVYAAWHQARVAPGEVSPITCAAEIRARLES